MFAQGFVHWELRNESTGKLTGKGLGQAETFYGKILNKLSMGKMHLPFGKRNAIVNHARNKLANALIGTAITYPTFVAVGTGTNAATASDTALQTKVLYDGTNEAKVVDTRSLKGDYGARLVVQFSTSEANATIQEIGLFEGNDADANMWARVSATITKTSSDRLTIYWYLFFERNPGLALKTGSSQQPTPSLVQGSSVAASFSPSVTLLRVHNNTGGNLYLRLNGALEADATPNNYDSIVGNGEDFILDNEEIDISSLGLNNVAGGSFTLPDNKLSISGW